MKKILFLFISLLAFIACSDSVELDIPDGGADLVVIGNIYTSDEHNPTAQAFVVHEGKYIYVGNKADAMKFAVDGKTQVLEPDAPMIMAGCTEGHGHYITEAVFKQLCYLKSDDFDGIVKEIKDYYTANKGNITQLFGYGWYEENVEEHLGEVRKVLDEITTEIPIYICDREMHQGWVNSKALELAGLKDDASKEQVDQTTLPGGTIYRDEHGVLTGRVQDQAGSFVRKEAFHDLLDDAGYRTAGLMAQNKLLSMGYTNYMDAWLSYDNSDCAYHAFYEMDQNNEMTMNVVGCYEIDSYKVKRAADYQKYVGEAKNWKNWYQSNHFTPNTIKLFADGCTESLMGYVLQPYPITGTNGVRNWDPELFDEIVKYINDNGLLVHTHCYGDAAVQYVLDAYVKSYNAGNKVRNSLGHAASVAPEDMKRIAKYGVGVAENFNWHNYDPGYAPEHFFEYLGKDLFLGMYPMKRFFDENIPVCSSTDAPCSQGYPDDPFGIMEIMLTAVNPLGKAQPRAPEECVSKEQALAAMTINGAWNMGIEKERGSITKGKYADFIFISQDLLKDKPEQWHDTKVVQTWFEGKCVYHE